MISGASNSFNQTSCCCMGAAGANEVGASAADQDATDIREGLIEMLSSNNPPLISDESIETLNSLPDYMFSASNPMSEIFQGLANMAMASGSEFKVQSMELSNEMLDSNLDLADQRVDDAAVNFAVTLVGSAASLGIGFQASKSMGAHSPKEVGMSAEPDLNMFPIMISLSNQVVGGVSGLTQAIGESNQMEGRAYVDDMQVDKDLMDSWSRDMSSMIDKIRSAA